MTSDNEGNKMNDQNPENFDAFAYFRYIYSAYLRWFVLVILILLIFFTSLILDLLWNRTGINDLFLWLITGLFVFKIPAIWRIINFKSEVYSGPFRLINFVRWKIIFAALSFLLGTLLLSLVDLFTMGSFLSAFVVLVWLALAQGSNSLGNLDSLFSIFGGLTIFSATLMLVKETTVRHEKAKLERKMTVTGNQLNKLMDGLLEPKRISTFLEKNKPEKISESDRRAAQNILSSKSLDDLMKNEISSTVYLMYLKAAKKALKGSEKITINPPKLPNEREARRIILNEFINEKREILDEFLMVLESEISVTIVKKERNENDESDILTKVEKAKLQKIKESFEIDLSEIAVIPSFLDELSKSSFETFDPREPKETIEDEVLGLTNFALVEIVKNWLFEEARAMPEENQKKDKK